MAVLERKLLLTGSSLLSERLTVIFRISQVLRWCIWIIQRRAVGVDIHKNRYIYMRCSSTMKQGRGKQTMKSMYGVWENRVHIKEPSKEKAQDSDTYKQVR